ncbi:MULTISPECIES: thioesterase II family protein [Bradyrhizobium]|uniref:thioesterase II family protein n=1 Tax=Bradyrhizobium TaxID=374 RepID=UPI0018AD5CC0|nr:MULTISPECIES: alpha/beta fold hydrolase [Bradyrhizobium]MBR1001966.1 thioesterase [Bradyrhizobium liaoningense]
MNLICLPYAGGGASIYAAWQARLPDFIKVRAVQLPGRESRISEPACRDLDLLQNFIFESVQSCLDQPYVLFGHSNGALLAFELASRVRGRQFNPPLGLIVSASRSPQAKRPLRKVNNLPHGEFIAELKRIGGTPAEVLANPELMALVMPALRADFAINETYEYRAHPPLSCPIRAYGGADDRSVSSQDLEDWRQQTAASFSLRRFTGDHFFLRAARDELFQWLAHDISDFQSGAVEWRQGRRP